MKSCLLRMFSSDQGRDLLNSNYELQTKHKLQDVAIQRVHLIRCLATQIISIYNNPNSANCKDLI